MKKAVITIVAIALSFATLAQKDAEFSNERMDNSLKFNFIAPLTGYTSFSFERYLKPGINWEAGIGIIGLGLNKQEGKPFGINLSGGLKIYHRNTNRSFWNNCYVMPELQVSFYNERQSIWHNVYDYHEGYSGYWTEYKRENVLATALMLTFGKENIWRNVFITDWFFSIGYMYSTTGWDNYYYGFLGGGEDFPISFMAGLKIGYIFSSNKSRAITD
jgi:hypothetical protein